MSNIRRLRPSHADKFTVAARQAVAEQMADALFELEDGVEEALGQSAALILRVVSERKRLNLSIFHGQPIVDEALGLVASLADARARSARLHKAMDLTQRQVGVHVMTNPGDKPDQGTTFIPEAKVDSVPQAAGA